MSELPSGTLTFLFTDIEGSTRRWESDPEGMAATVSRHDDLLRVAIRGHDGFLFQTAGDAFSAAFVDAPSALAAALAAQRAFSALRGDPDRDLRVRMALHTGPAIVRDREYFGPPTLNRLSRLLTAANGGQVLLSAATEELVRDHLPESVSLRDLGERGLRDLVRPERIFQLVAPDLPAHFPPLKTIVPRPNNLPSQPTALIGRDRDVEVVSGLLRRPDVRLVTLTGPGGTGKTRLCLQVAAETLDDFEDGAFFVPLANVSDPSLTLPAIASTLNVAETPEQPLVESLKSYLRSKSLLLVLDNFEQVVDAGSDLAGLLRVGSKFKLLVTSREHLNVYGEYEFPVTTLAHPALDHLPSPDALAAYPAVELFVQRAGAVRFDFALTEENAPAVAAICARLDGLPLAIELAAARTRQFTPQEMLVPLEHRLSLLTGGHRDLPPRQQTMHAAISWSYDLLKPRERALFARLSVFVGGWRLGAGRCRLWDWGEQREIETLVEKNLLRREKPLGETRYGMLETIREFAVEKLDESGEAEVWRERHALYFLEMAQHGEAGLMGAEQSAWLDRLEQEHDNLRAALEWSRTAADAELGLRLAGSLWRFWDAHSHLSEGRSRLRAALAHPGASAPTQGRAAALCGAGHLAEVQGDYALAREDLEDSIEIARSLGDKRQLAVSLTALGPMYISLGEPPAAKRLIEESLQLCREMDEPWLLAQALHELGNINQYCDADYARARAHYEESITLLRQVGDRWFRAVPLQALSDLADAAADYPTVQALLEETLEIRRSLGNRRGIAVSLLGLGELAKARGDYEEASRLINESRAIFTELGDKGYLWALLDLGDIALLQGDYATASGLFQEALALDRARGNKVGIAAALRRIGYIALYQNDPDTAIPLFRESLSLLTESSNPTLIPRCLIGIAGVAALYGQPERVAHLCGAAEALLETIGLRLDEIDHRQLDRAVGIVRPQYGDAEWAMAWGEGRGMSAEQACAYASETACTAA